jgi:acyl-CoA synthetase (NDP forming)
VLTDPRARPDGAGLAAVFEPRRVALVGASDRAGTIGKLVWDNLADFPGDVVPVSRSATVGGRTAYPDLRDVPGDVDLAVIATPAAAVPEVVSAAAAKGVRAVVVLSAGFAETGQAGARLQRAAVAAARAGGVRLVGPNCFGVQNASLPLNASIAAGLPRGGGVAIVTQSGSYGMAVHALGQDEGLPTGKVFAAGNKADITDAELLAYLRADPGTEVICLLLESVDDGRAFFDQAALTTAVKPVIAVVGGRTAAGARAAVSHTASLAADDAVLDAALAQAGVARVRTGQQALDAARAMSGQPLPRGPRVAIITNSGGTGVELADLLSDEGLTLPELSRPLQAKLAGLLPEYGSPRNPVDMTPAWRLFSTVYPAAIDLLARSGEIDLIVPVLLQRSASAEIAAAVADAVGRLRADRVPVPVYVCWVAPRGADAQASVLADAGIGCFSWPERTARAAGVAVRCGMRTAARAVAGPAQDGPGRRTQSRPTARRDRLPPGLLPTLTARDLLVGAGIDVVETRRCGSPADAAAAAGRLGYPVVVKVDHPALTHKSDAGGVRLGLADPGAVTAAAAGLLALADGAAVLVQRQHQGTELIVGGLRDPSFGPVVLAGLGGVLVEALGDVRLALAPLDEAAALAMLASLRGAAILHGIRGRPGVNLPGLARLIVRTGDLLASHPEIAELDLNPILATPDGCPAADWRIRVAENRT